MYFLMIFISLMIIEVKNFFIYLLAIHVFFVKMPIHFLSFFFFNRLSYQGSHLCQFLIDFFFFFFFFFSVSFLCFCCMVSKFFLLFQMLSLHFADGFLCCALSKCPLMNEWMNDKTLIYVHIIEYYSVIKKEIPPFVTNRWSQMTKLSESSQTQKDKSCMISLICEI